eukprot:2722978-Prymnesium_polylepis.1
MASAGDLAGEFAAHARWEGDTCVISLSTDGENCQSLSLCTVRAQEVPEGSDGADGKKMGGDGPAVNSATNLGSKSLWAVQHAKDQKVQQRRLPCDICHGVG